MIETVADLCGKWRLSYAGHDELLRLGYTDKNDPELSAPALCIPGSAVLPSVFADVPGNFELDLFKAGIEGDPYFGANTENYRKYETYHLFYRKNFTFRGGREGLYLRFDGIDTASDVYLNGRLIARTENAFITHTVPVDGALLQTENELCVHIKPAALYVGKYPDTKDSCALKYSKPFLQLRKPASSAGWDIAPRFICGGIWRGVYLIRKTEPYIDEVFIYTEELRGADAVLRVKIAAKTGEDGFSAAVTGVCGDSRFSGSHPVRGGVVDFTVTVRNALLWYPRNYGYPYLYDTEISLLYGGDKVDTVKLRVGIRTVSLDRSEEDGGRFDFYVNGQRIFIMGTNWVPADAFHSRDRERMSLILPMLTDLGCNCVRCWGGNVYECDEFFDFCDENGILVWQDFSMACGVYPTDAGFVSRLSDEARSVVGKYRNRASLLLWAGDNECDQTAAYAAHLDPNGNILTRKVLPQIVSELDPSRPFLPSSPYIDETAYRRGALLSEDHFWGPRDYYKGDYYKNAAAKFASETGYHGCPPPASLYRFLSPSAAEHPIDPDGGVNIEWLYHSASPESDRSAPFAYRIPLMISQVRELLGCVPDGLEELSAASRLSQAEAMKYFIERMRLRKVDHGGIIWWNLIDCWPQISDAVVDYYGEKKLAYHVIKTVQSPVVLMAEEPENGAVRLIADSELCADIMVRYEVFRYGSGTVAEGVAAIGAHSRSDCGCIAYDGGFLIMKWEYEDGQRTVHGVSHYVADARGTDLAELIKQYTAAGYGGLI